MPEQPEIARSGVVHLLPVEARIAPLTEAPVQGQVTITTEQVPELPAPAGPVRLQDTAGVRAQADPPVTAGLHRQAPEVEAQVL